jgi:hypothetical protein
MRTENLIGRMIVMALTLLAALPSFGLAAAKSYPVNLPQSAFSARDPDVPFPLSTAFIFNNITGTWAASGPDFEAVFSFEVQQSCDSTKILRVLHVSPESGEVVAEGTGIAIDEQHTVRAGMLGVTGGYMLFINFYRDRFGKVTPMLKITTFTNIGGGIEIPIEQISVEALSNSSYRVQAKGGCSL